jgi:hypothetical protein
VEKWRRNPEPGSTGVQHRNFLLFFKKCRIEKLSAFLSSSRERGGNLYRFGDLP